MRRYERMAVGLTASLMLSAAGARENQVSQAPFTPFTVAGGRTEPREITVEAGRGVIGVCQYVQEVTGDWNLNVRYEMQPATYLHDLLMNGRDVGGLAEELDLRTVRVTVLRPPAHGQLGTGPAYLYHPSTGYVGNDKIIFNVRGRDLINGQSMNYKMIFFIKVIPEIRINSRNALIVEKRYCPDAAWRISSSDSELSVTNHFAATIDRQSLLGSARFSEVLGETSSDIRIEVESLDGMAVGRVQGTTITLEPAAAGHSWFIDYTPYLND